jgi:hypothetical protein
MASDWLATQGIERPNESGEGIGSEGGSGAGQNGTGITTDMAKENALSTAVSLANSSASGLKEIRDTKAYRDARAKYEEAGGSRDRFDELVDERANVTGGHFPDGSGVVSSSTTGLWSGWDNLTVKVGDKEIKNVTVSYKKDGTGKASAEAEEAIRAYSNQNPDDGWIAMYDNEPYIYWRGYWRKVTGNHSDEKWNTGYKELKEAMYNHLNSYKTGGLADFTGPAWLDGTPSKPEYVLNAAQTERFFSLIDILEGIDTK